MNTNEVSLKLYNDGERRVKIDQETQDKCWQFANDWVAKNPSKYKDTGQTDANTVRNQIFFGKVGEVAVRIFANKTFKGAALNDVDYTLYEDKDKSWDSDLNVDGVPLHVKSYCPKMWGSRIPRSWTFQYKSNGRIDVLFSERKSHAQDIVVGCEVSDCSPTEGLYADVILIGRWSELLPYIGYPVFESQKANKRDIYYQTILDVLNGEEFITI